MTQTWLEKLQRGTDLGLEGELAALRVGLTAEAEREGLLDLAFAATSTPVGELLLVASPQGVVRVAFETESQDAVLADLAERLSPRILPSAERLAPAVRELEEYFAGQRRHFEVPVDLRLTRGFRAEVVRSLAGIEFGLTLSYAQVAQAVGNPGAVRAVGTACATNPVPLFLPCHRVVRSDGSFGAYRGGHEVKQFLLELERAA